MAGKHLGTTWFDSILASFIVDQYHNYSASATSRRPEMLTHETAIARSLKPSRKRKRIPRIEDESRTWPAGTLPLECHQPTPLPPPVPSSSSSAIKFVKPRKRKRPKGKLSVDKCAGVGESTIGLNSICRNAPECSDQKVTNGSNAEHNIADAPVRLKHVGEMRQK